MRALIVGGGIGGLAAALALRRVGIEPLVLERAAEIREVGAGLALWSNAVNALRELGLEEAVLAAGSPCERNLVRTPAGRQIVINDFGETSRRAGATCVWIHRAALQKILLEALPVGSVRTGACCTGFKESTTLIQTSDGSAEQIEADLLVGADGISSVIRDGLEGPQLPRYAGYTCWRGICRDNGLLPECSALLVIGSGSQFGVGRCGAGLFYWFLTKNAPLGTRQTKADALAVVRDWAAPVPEIVHATPENVVLQNDILDRRPLRCWGRGPVTLLGDAAHASTPNLGQGACQAIEDALVLAHCLSRTQQVEAALREYERLRIPRTAMVVRHSWRLGRVLLLDSSVLETWRNWFMGSWIGKRLATKMLETLLVHKAPKLDAGVGLRQESETQEPVL